jgi:hypothetical protein
MKRKEMAGMLAGVAGMLVGGVMMLILLAACEREVGSERGGKVAILFSVGCDDALRSLNEKKIEPETAVVELDSEEGYFLAATLSPDEEVRAVTTSALINGQKVHLEAYYHSSGALAGAADYHADAAGRLILDNPAAPLEVDPADGPFDFSAYSYYKSTASISTTGINPRTADLIWGNIENQTITATETGRTVSFNLKHKFARVRVKVSVGKIAGAEIKELGTVRVEGQKTVGLTVKDGALAGGSNLGALDVSSSLTTADDITYVSDYYVFYPSPTKVTISGIKITENMVDYPLTGLSADFAQALTAGESYTLAVDVQKQRWAYSNIYWEGEFASGYLTFDRKNLGNEDYQGVYFKFGSLVGIGPNEGRRNYQASLFIPNTSDGTWDGSKYANSAGNPWAGTTYTSIPYLTSLGGAASLYDMGDSGYSAYAGDICNYIDSDWRMPNTDELNAVIAGHVTAAFYGTISGDAEAVAMGKRRMDGYGVISNSIFGVAFWPASGARNSTPTNPENEFPLAIGEAGDYRDGTQTSYIMALRYNLGSIFSFRIANGGTIRCIRKLPTD